MQAIPGVIRYAAPCLFGLEGLVANEMRFLGAENVMAENGRVLFSGGFDMMARANIWSRYSERILILLDEFKAETFEELFEGVKAIPWSQYLNKNDAFPVKGRSLNSALKSVPDCQRIIKKAVAEKLKDHYKLPWFEESGPVHQIQFLIFKDKASIMIDTSGDGLHKRGYRAVSNNEAPIKETLAAAMAELSRVRSNHVVIDPMCGSGTIVIEAAMKAMKVAPGLNRCFSAEKWTQVPREAWKTEREKAFEEIKSECGFQGFGYDIDEGVLATAMENAKKAGVADKIEFKKRDIREFSRQSGRGTVITNPPYGERMLDVARAEELYKVMGKKFEDIQGWSYTIISPDENFEKHFKRKASKRRKLYNGMIKCQVYLYWET